MWLDVVVHFLMGAYVIYSLLSVKNDQIGISCVQIYRKYMCVYVCIYGAQQENN